MKGHVNGKFLLPLDENQPIEEDIAQAGEEVSQADDVPPFTQDSQLVPTEILPRTHREHCCLDPMLLKICHKKKKKGNGKLFYTSNQPFQTKASWTKSELQLQLQLSFKVWA